MGCWCKTKLGRLFHKITGVFYPQVFNRPFHSSVNCNQACHEGEAEVDLQVIEVRNWFRRFFCIYLFCDTTQQNV